MDRKVEVNGTELTVRYVYDEDTGMDCADIYENGKYIGTISDVYFPDEDDEESVEYFESEIEGWYNNQ